MEGLEKSGIPAEHLAAASEQLQLIKLTDPKAAVEDIAKYQAAVIGLARAYDMLDGKTEQEYLKFASGSAAAVAARTPLSTGTFIQAKSRFMPLAAATGMPLEQQDAMLGVLAARNIQADPASTTLRSNITRILSPTVMQMKSWEANGLNRADFISSGNMDPTRTMQFLRAGTGGRLAGKDLAAVERQLMVARKDGTLASESSRPSCKPSS